MSLWWKIPHRLLFLCSCAAWNCLYANSCCQFAAACMVRTRRFSHSAHGIIDRKDREVEIGGAEIIKRSQSVTHRLLSVNTGEDQTSLSSDTPHDNSLFLAHIHILYMNRDKCVWAIKKCKSLSKSHFYPETDRSRSETRGYYISLHRGIYSMLVLFLKC